MGFFPPTPPAGSPHPKGSAWDMFVFTLTQFCTQTTSVLPTSDHSSPGLRVRKTARSRSWNHTGFWSVAKPVSEVRFIDRVTTCKQHMLPLLQTFCRKDALCTDNHRHAGWNPALRNARHLSKLSVLHWPLPEGTQKVCLCERFVSGMGSKRFGLSAPCGAVCGNMTWAQRGKCGMQNQGCCVIRIPGMQLGLSCSSQSCTQAAYGGVGPSSPCLPLLCPAVLSSALLLAASVSLCFASRASWRCSRRGAVCRILPAVPCQNSSHLGEQESCDFPGFTMQNERMLFFPYPFCTFRFFHRGPFSVGGENFAVGLETGNWARGERGKHLVTKLLQCLSEKQYSVKLFPTIKSPSALKLWALSWQSDGCCFMSICEIKAHTPHMLSFILEPYLRSSVQVSDWAQLPLRWESLIFLLSHNCFLRVTYIKK